jgi:hypothetical protein
VSTARTADAAPQGPRYWYLVESDTEAVNPSKPNSRKLYQGYDIADAMAAWSKAVSEGAEYIVMEALVRKEQIPEPSPAAQGSLL